MPTVFERFVEQLRLGAQILSVDPVAEVATLTSFLSLDLPAPLVLRVPSEKLHGWVVGLGDEDLQELWPGTPRERAAFNLLLVHLEEELATAKLPPREAVLAGGSWRVSP